MFDFYIEKDHKFICNGELKVGSRLEVFSEQLDIQCGVGTIYSLCSKIIYFLECSFSCLGEGDSCGDDSKCRPGLCCNSSLANNYYGMCTTQCNLPLSECTSNEDCMPFVRCIAGGTLSI